MNRQESTQPIQSMGEGYRLLPVPPTVQGDVSVPLRRMATTVGLLLVVCVGVFVLCVGDAVGGPAVFVGLVLLGAGAMRGRQYGGWDKWGTLLLVCGVALLGAGALLIASAYLAGVVLVLAGAVGEWEWQHQLKELAPRGMGYEEQRTPAVQAPQPAGPVWHRPIVVNRQLWTDEELAYRDRVRFVDLALRHGTSQRNLTGLSLRAGTTISQRMWDDMCKELAEVGAATRDGRGNLKWAVERDGKADREGILDKLGIPAKYRG